MLREILTKLLADPEVEWQELRNIILDVLQKEFKECDDLVEQFVYWNTPGGSDDIPEAIEKDKHMLDALEEVFGCYVVDEMDIWSDERLKNRP